MVSSNLLYLLYLLLTTMYYLYSLEYITGIAFQELRPGSAGEIKCTKSSISSAMEEIEE